MRITSFVSQHTLVSLAPHRPLGVVVVAAMRCQRTSRLYATLQIRDALLYARSCPGTSRVASHCVARGRSVRLFLGWCYMGEHPLRIGIRSLLGCICAVAVASRELAYRSRHRRRRKPQGGAFFDRCCMFRGRCSSVSVLPGVPKGTACLWTLRGTRTTLARFVAMSAMVMPHGCCSSRQWSNHGFRTACGITETPLSFAAASGFASPLTRRPPSVANLVGAALVRIACDWCFDGGRCDPATIAACSRRRLS